MGATVDKVTTTDNDTILTFDYVEDLGKIFDKYKRGTPMEFTFYTEAIDEGFAKEVAACFRAEADKLENNQK